MTSIVATTPGGKREGPTLHIVPFHGKHMDLVIDESGVRWVALGSLAMILGASLGDLIQRMDSNPAVWRYRSLDIPAIQVGGSRVCIRTEMLPSFLHEIVREKRISPVRIAMFYHLRNEGMDVLNSFDPTPAPLIVIKPQVIEGTEVNSVNARDLHRFLEVGKDFSNWIKDRIQAFGFTEHKDFEVVEVLRSPESASSKARPQMAKEYALTLDMAKELSMVERNAKGKQARAYFIECERKALQGPAISAKAIQALSDQVREIQGAVLSIHNFNQAVTAQFVKSNQAKGRSRTVQADIRKRIPAAELTRWERWYGPYTAACMAHKADPDFYPDPAGAPPQRVITTGLGLPEH